MLGVWVYASQNGMEVVFGVPELHRPAEQCIFLVLVLVALYHLSHTHARSIEGPVQAS